MELRFSIGLEEPLLANGVKQVITKKPGFHLSQLCFNFTDLLIDIQSNRSNFIILDPDLKSFNPSQDLDRIKQVNPNAKVALICKNAGKAIFHNLLDIGFDGMILSCCSEAEILKAIEKIVALGLPPVFIYVYDEVWQVFKRLSELVVPILLNYAPAQFS